MGERWRLRRDLEFRKDCGRPRISACTTRKGTRRRPVSTASETTRRRAQRNLGIRARFDSKSPRTRQSSRTRVHRPKMWSPLACKAVALLAYKERGLVMWVCANRRWLRMRPEAPNTPRRTRRARAHRRRTCRRRPRRIATRATAGRERHSVRRATGGARRERACSLRRTVRHRQRSHLYGQTSWSAHCRLWYCTIAHRRARTPRGLASTRASQTSVLAFSLRPRAPVNSAMRVGARRCNLRAWPG